MDGRIVAALSALVTIGVYLSQVGLEYVGSWGPAEVPRWVPRFGTAGEMVVATAIVAEILEPLVIAISAVGLGYYVGRRLDDVPTDRHFLRAVTAGSTVAALGLWVVLRLIGNSWPADGVAVLISLALFVEFFSSITVPLVVGSIAGAALAHFRTTPPPTRPEETDHGTAQPERVDS